MERMASSSPICKSSEHRTRDCPEVSETESFVMTYQAEMAVDAGDEPGRVRKAVKPKGARPKSAALGSREKPTVVDLENDQLTVEEAEFIRKRREKHVASAARVRERKALTGQLADYPSLSHCWSEELGLNIAASTTSRMRTWCWKKFVWMVRIKAAVEKDGDRRWKRNRRWPAS